MAKKRITELATETTLKDGQYVAIDHTTDGTKKLNLGAELTDLKEDLKLKADLPTETIENASIASFTDGAEDAPVKELKVGIEPIQSGSGDPSPTNVRPISGHDSVTVTRTGVNVWDEEWEVGSLTQDGNNYASTTRFRSKNPIPVVPDTTYYVKSPNTCDIHFYAEDGTHIAPYAQKQNATFVTPSNASYIKFCNATGATYNHDISINYPSTDHDYHSGADNASYPFPLSSTIYGGTLEVETGVLTVTHGLVESYNGETLPSTWISDRDVYAEGTTPTTGAEVVYALATPTTVQLTPAQVTTLLKDNNIFADSGDIVKLIYIADLGAYIEKLINA